ncbi:factor-independent urate hydroxylase [Allokutzneria oryzae]|uniref:Uricase n=1 Tax=Allokutzneria oryzae TaxID=1378989 RepID=A0ABV5ZSF7_9PSEU
MAITLGGNQYGKAEVRLVRVDLDGERHRVTDLNVSVALSGDLTDTHLTGGNAHVLPTDTQKNTVYAFARDGVGEIEEFGLRLGEHFVRSQPAIHRARVAFEQYTWDRVEQRPHSFVRNGSGTRTATVTWAEGGVHVVSGLTGLTVMNTTDSEFWGYVKDGYTTLPETTDRILATAVDARWRHDALPSDWAKSYEQARNDLLAAFSDTYSLSLQQTLYAMGQRVLDNQPGIAEIRLALPNKHHFLVDLAPFGLDNPNEVFYAADRPYGLIEGTVRRDDLPEQHSAW